MLSSRCRTQMFEVLGGVECKEVREGQQLCVLRKHPSNEAGAKLGPSVDTSVAVQFSRA